MFYSTLLLATAALCGLATAQNGTFSTSGPLMVDPNSVPIATRDGWCIGQRGNCPLACGGSASHNNCYPDNLTFVCTCTDNSHPNFTSFSNMLPSFICGQWIVDCKAAAGNDLPKLTACVSVQCGDKNASAVPQTNGRGSSSSSASSSSASPTGTKTGGAKQSSTPTGAAVALSIGKSCGTGLLGAGLLAVFGLAL